MALDPGYHGLITGTVIRGTDMSHTPRKPEPRINTLPMQTDANSLYLANTVDSSQITANTQTSDRPVTFNLSVEALERVRELSKKLGIPMNTIVDSALKNL